MAPDRAVRPSARLSCCWPSPGTQPACGPLPRDVHLCWTFPPAPLGTAVDRDGVPPPGGCCWPVAGTTEDVLQVSIGLGVQTPVSWAGGACLGGRLHPGTLLLSAQVLLSPLVTLLCAGVSGQPLEHVSGSSESGDPPCVFHLGPQWGLCSCAPLELSGARRGLVCSHRLAFCGAWSLLVG